MKTFIRIFFNLWSIAVVTAFLFTLFEIMSEAQVPALWQAIVLFVALVPVGGLVAAGSTLGDFIANSFGGRK